MSVPFTQYLLPDGRKRKIEIDLPEEVEAKARKLLQKGYFFDAEILTTGIVSLTCQNILDEDTPVAIELSENGPGIVDKATKLINDSFKTARLK